MKKYPRRRTVCRVTKLLRSKDCRQHRRAQRTTRAPYSSPSPAHPSPTSYQHRSVQISEPSPPTSRQARIRPASTFTPLTHAWVPPTIHETPLLEGPSESRGSRPTTKGAFLHHERSRTNASSKGARQQYRKPQGKQQTGGDKSMELISIYFRQQFKWWPVSWLQLCP